MTVWWGRRVTNDWKVSYARDRGFLLGDGLFETVLVTGGKAPLLDRHLERMSRSAGALGMRGGQPLLSLIVSGEIEGLWRMEGRPARAALRIQLTRGSGRGLTPPDPGGPPGVFMTFDALPDEAPTTPLRAVVVAAPRIDPLDPLAGHKTLSAMSRVEARRAALAAGADVALLTTVDGDVAEADAANLFVVLDGVLVTPPLDRGVLPGITRARCLQLENCVERRITIEDLARAAEAFLTSSLDGARPLSEIDGRALRGPAVASSRLARKLEGSDFPEVSGPHNASR